MYKIGYLITYIYNWSAVLTKNLIFCKVTANIGLKNLYINYWRPLCYTTQIYDQPFIKLLKIILIDF